MCWTSWKKLEQIFQEEEDRREEKRKEEEEDKKMKVTNGLEVEVFSVFKSDLSPSLTTLCPFIIIVSCLQLKLSFGEHKSFYD